MSTDYRAGTGPDERTPFGSLLDAIIPALFPNDAALAKRLGVNQSQVHRWRRDVRPQITMLVRISEATGISVETLAKIVSYEASDRAERVS
jgi:transcriptional regulator with XRE-family HTH domain